MTSVSFKGLTGRITNHCPSLWLPHTHQQQVHDKYLSNQHGTSPAPPTQSQISDLEILDHKQGHMREKDTASYNAVYNFCQV